MPKKPSMILVGAIWGGLLLGALSIAQIPGDWGHAVCGPWGCGPPVQALWGCHLAWLVALAPVGYLVHRHVALPWPRVMGLALTILSVMALASFALYQGLVWYPKASEWHRGFFVQRCLFLIVTTVDIPILQSFLMGAALLVWPKTMRETSANGYADTEIPSEGFDGTQQQTA